MTMKKSNASVLSQNIQTRHELHRLCAEAINRQIESGEAAPTHLRNRRRYLSKQILKRIPHASRLSPKKLLHAAMMVLAMWGFGAMTMPQQVEAAPLFKHFMLNGFNVVEGDAPTFVDIDNDGDLDVFVGSNYGKVMFYRNTGTATAPMFAPANGTTIVNPLAGFDVGTSAHPDFVDIDNDGDLDVFVGEFNGTVKFYRNTGTVAAPVFTADVAGNPLASFSVFRRAAPAFADIDNDGDLDVFIGENFGSVVFFRNTGTVAAPVFTAEGAATNPLNGFRVVAAATPAFVDIDHDGDLDVFVGEYGGTVKFYRNIGTAASPLFISYAAGNPLAGFIAGGESAPTFADIDNDGDFDAFIGEASGSNGVKFYRNTGTAVVPVFPANAEGNPMFGSHVPGPTPTFVDIDHDGDLDAFVGGRYGTVKFYRNTGTLSAPAFVAANGTTIVNPLAAANGTAPAFADIDHDGDLDAFIAWNYGTVKFYRNTGTASAPVFVADATGNPLAVVNVGGGHKVHLALADIDNDGDFDAFIANYNGFSTAVKFYRNVGTITAPVFFTQGITMPGFHVSRGAAPTFVDIDHDGDLDAFVGDDSGTVTFYRNTGTAAASVFVADATGNPLAGFDVGRSATPAFADIDNDGDFDAFIGENYGKVEFFKNFDPSPAPVADSVSTTAGIAVTTGDVTANDIFKPEGPAANFLPITAFTQGTNGAVTNNGNNTFIYTPNAGFAGSDAFTYTLDDGAGNTAIGTVNVTVNAPPVSTVGLSLNGAAFRTGSAMTLTAMTAASNPPTVADVYVALQLPDGTLLVMQPGGSFSTTLTPLLSNIAVPAFNGPIFNFTFSGAEPVGNYTWFAAFTTPGTLNIIGALATAPFTFAP